MKADTTQAILVLRYRCRDDKAPVNKYLLYWVRLGYVKSFNIPYKLRKTCVKSEIHDTRRPSTGNTHE